MVSVDKNIKSNSRDIGKLVENLAFMVEGGSTEGEKNTAMEKLNLICMKYGVDYDGMGTVKSKARCFKYSNSESRDILSQCIFELIYGVEVVDNYTDKKLVAISTLAQYIEVYDMFNHYWKLYRQQRKRLIETFKTSFIEVNNIGLKPPDNACEKLNEKPTITFCVDKELYVK